MWGFFIILQKKLFLTRTVFFQDEFTVPIGPADEKKIYRYSTLFSDLWIL